MSNNFFAYLSRMRYIERWSLMLNALPENIQEHSHMVAVLANALGVIRRDVFHVPCNPEEYAAVALYHDCSEILTGDLPTPIKYHSPEIMDAYRQVEQLACDKLLDTLPTELRGAFQPVLDGETAARCHDLVKRTLESYRLPEVDYFLEHFIPAFELTLDELGTIED